MQRRTCNSPARRYWHLVLFFLAAAAAGQPATLPNTGIEDAAEAISSTHRHFTEPISSPAVGTEIPSSGSVSTPLYDFLLLFVCLFAPNIAFYSITITPIPRSTSSVTPGTLSKPSSSAGSSTTSVATSQNATSSTSSGTSPLTSSTSVAPTTGSSAVSRNHTPLSKLTLLVTLCGVWLGYN